MTNTTKAQKILNKRMNKLVAKLHKEIDRKKKQKAREVARIEKAHDKEIQKLLGNIKKARQIQMNFKG